MRVLVYGAGGIGLYFAARLSLAGIPVTLKGRTATVAAVRRTPITIRHGSGVAVAPAVRVVDRLESEESFDAVILAVKAWQVDEAAHEIAPVLASGGRVITTQNGVDSPAHAGAHVGEDNVIAGTCVVIAQRLDASTVEYVGSDATMTLGYLAGGEADQPARQTIAALTQAGITAGWTEDIRRALWKKLALISSYGGVGAISGATAGETRAVPESRELVTTAMREAFAVAQSLGVALTDTDLADILHTYLHVFSPETTASMQRDLASGLPSELADQNGAVVRHGREQGVATPVQATIYASQLPRETAARGR
ncbi:MULTISPECIES: ketopantoate reductase family protein [Actinoalloteichus]|uniref:2-dehydropantoate 2-reductase n=1 Tax=Actinoalloteichus fjordicus TaxID=1612552 RepID=A0AAC9LAY1_9PSEU|nr:MULTISPECIES: ketopantoate reductase family protein [Actinoalloteichus]APU13545.1 2-dehydropantoate 2-reductase [Actinoalloteichus fjordicus]APU19494.1 2-dehydropantoate 2-reductase [Actinoalloteichus sp. GBA129-24]